MNTPAYVLSTAYGLTPPSGQWSAVPLMGLHGSFGCLMVIPSPIGWRLVLFGSAAHKLYPEVYPHLPDALTAAELTALTTSVTPVTWISHVSLIRIEVDTKAGLQWAANVPMLNTEGTDWPVLIVLSPNTSATLEQHRHYTLTASSRRKAVELAESWRPPEDAGWCSDCLELDA